MRKANPTYKALLFLTFFFAVIAACSFAVFQETKTLCSSGSKKCSEAIPSKNSGGQMLWDDFSRRFISLVSVR